MRTRRLAPRPGRTVAVAGPVAGPVAGLVVALLAAACTAALPGAAPTGATGPIKAAPAASSATSLASPSVPATTTSTTAATPTSPGPTTPRSTTPTSHTRGPATATTRAPAAHTATAPVLRVLARPIPYGPTRRAEMAAYAKRHYGVDSATLHPKVIVLHFTAGDSAASAISTFSRDTAALGELPGTCAHYVVDYSGVAYHLVPTSVMCRHAIGLNHVAIGIEVVQPTNGHSSAWADQQILARTAQVGGLLALVRSLQHEYGIPTTMVYGHATANSCPLFRDLQGWRNDHTDWGAAAVTELRHRLDALP